MKRRLPDISGYGWLFVYSAILYITLSIGAEAFAVPYAYPLNTLYSTDVDPAYCSAPALEHLFSGFVCRYQTIVDEILTDLYYGMLDFFRPPFYAALILFVITVGCTFALGLLPFTTRDIMLIMGKIALVTSFAMYPNMMIDLIYYGLIGFMKETTDTVVATLAPQGSVAGIFEWMDQQFYDFITLQDAAQTSKKCENDVLAFMFGLAVTMPPIFIMAMYLLFQLVMVLIRTVLGYLIAITGIMFLTTMAPLFLGFAFFGFTKSYFEKWLQYLISFTIQIFVVFSFIAVVLSLPFEAKMKGIMDTIKPYEKVAYHDGQRLDFNDWCTICLGESLGEVNPSTLADGTNNCTSDIMTPTNIAAGGVGEFIDFVGKEVLILAVMAYLVESILKTAPEIAKYLSQSPHIPSMVGQLPAPLRLGNATEAGWRAAQQTGGSVVSKGTAGVRSSISTLIGGVDP